MSWAALSFWTFLAGAFGCAVLAAWMLQKKDGRADRTAVLAGLAVTSLWCLAGAAIGPDSASASLLEAVRNLAWLNVLVRLFANSGAERERTVAVRPVLVALVLVELLHPLVLAAAGGQLVEGPGQLSGFAITVIIQLAFVVGALMLVNQLYAQSLVTGNASLRWCAAALATMWICDLNFYTVAYLGDVQPPALDAVRGGAAALMAALFAIGRSKNAEKRIRPSRTVAFQTLSFVVVGLYFAIMAGAAHWLARLGEGTPPLAQIGFVFTSAILALIVLPSGQLRGWIKVIVAKHLFQHRYDYRAEWLRFTHTIGRGDGEASLHQRLIQALADITDSPAGLLLVPGDHDELELAARWQWRTMEVPAVALAAAARSFFERDGYIIALDMVRLGSATEEVASVVPEWLRGEGEAWALVPLLHFERLVGVIVLARPAHARELDWEDFDLLRVVGRQLASYLAEHAGQEALLDASRFDEFNRRIAFVMHDIKNLASQLTLLSRNAERHGDNPAFRVDMQVTVRNAADKLNALLARLSRYGAASHEHMAEVDPNEVIRRVAATLGRSHPVMVTSTLPELRVLGNRDSLEQVLLHLVQNAIDASPANAPITLALRSEGIHAAIEVVDAGTGMSADFVRNRLFKPFVSTKAGGFGIGAFEARELVRAMQGRLDVESREGLGSRFTVRLPIAEAAGLMEKFRRNAAGVAPGGSHIAEVA